jgi:hypothetical protein
MVRRISVMLVLAGVFAGGTTFPAAHAASGVEAFHAKGFSIKLGDQTCWIGSISKRLSIPPANPNNGQALICAAPLLILRDRASRVAPRLAGYLAFFSDGTFTRGTAPVVVLANEWIFPGVNTPGSTAFFPGGLVGALSFHGHRADGTFAFAGLG